MDVARACREVKPSCSRPLVGTALRELGPPRRFGSRALGDVSPKLLEAGCRKKAYRDVFIAPAHFQVRLSSLGKKCLKMAHARVFWRDTPQRPHFNNT